MLCGDSQSVQEKTIATMTHCTYIHVYTLLNWFMCIYMYISTSCNVYTSVRKKSCSLEHYELRIYCFCRPYAVNLIVFLFFGMNSLPVIESVTYVLCSD